MSTISTTTNPYLIGYSSGDIIGSDTVLQQSPTTSSTSSSSSSSSSSGSYSQGLISSMSGFDVSSMVNEMMTSDYTKLNQLLGTEQKTQWTQDRERTQITNLNNFSSTYFDPLSSNYVLSPNSFLAYTATTPSGTTGVTATALNTAVAGNYTISTNNLATAASVSNVSTTATTNKLTNSSLFSTLTGGTTSGTISLTVNGKSVNYAYNASSTIGNVMSGLSSAAGVNFNYSELTNTFTATATTTGSASTLTVASADVSGSVTNQFLTNAFGYNADGTTTATTVTSPGKDGSFNITEPNGTAPTTVTESLNNFTIDGLNYNVTGNITTPVTINVASNVSGVVSKIQDFVNAYNNLTTGLDTLTSEKTQTTYPTLTYAQESKMTAAQITSWNDMSQQGDLSNDNELTSLQNEMRSAFSDLVSGSGLNMASLGLSTSDSIDPTQAGTLTLNVATLTAALQSNPNAVINQLTKTSTSYPTQYDASVSSAANQTRYNEEGIFQRLNDIVDKYASTMPMGVSGTRGLLVNEAGLATDATDTSTLGQSITNEKTAVTNFKTRITADKTRYTTQYTALQTSLSKLSSQQSYISSMLSSSSSN